MYYSYVMKEYYVAFSSVPKIKKPEWDILLNKFTNLEEAWGYSESNLKKLGFKNEWINSFINFRKNIEPKKILEDLTKNNIDVLCIKDREYPKSLKETYSPPTILYIKGHLKKEDLSSIAIVGSRKGSDYGKRATYEIAKKLAESNITIVSGLAIGLDTEAHKGAIDGGGRTIAVLANGLNSIYPSSNTSLANKIVENGCIISEQPPDMPALKQNFPARNRIISGISLGTLITEAGEFSGTLHTASFAIEQNKQIYAIPGSIYNPLAIGPNNLIKKGAKPVTSPQDILEDFGIEEIKIASKPEGPEEELIFAILKNSNLHIDQIASETKMPIYEISRILTLMEIKEKIRHLGGMIYSLK